MKNDCNAFYRHRSVPVGSEEKPGRHETRIVPNRKKAVQAHTSRAFLLMKKLFCFFFVTFGRHKRHQQALLHLNSFGDNALQAYEIRLRLARQMCRVVFSSVVSVVLFRSATKTITVHNNRTRNEQLINMKTN